MWLLLTIQKKSAVQRVQKMSSASKLTNATDSLYWAGCKESVAMVCCRLFWWKRITPLSLLCAPSQEQGVSAKISATRKWHVKCKEGRRCRAMKLSFLRPKRKKRHKLLSKQFRMWQFSKISHNGQFVSWFGNGLVEGIAYFKRKIWNDIFTIIMIGQHLKGKWSLNVIFKIVLTCRCSSDHYMLFKTQSRDCLANKH